MPIAARFVAQAFPACAPLTPSLFQESLKSVPPTAYGGTGFGFAENCMVINGIHISGVPSAVAPTASIAKRTESMLR